MSKARRIWTVGPLLAVTTDYLKDKGSGSPRLDAELLLAEALGEERVGLYLEPERPLTVQELTTYREFVRRRAEREPVAYILGRAAFRYLTLAVGPAVLIPRPETEELVDAALQWLKEHPLPPAEEPLPRVLDLGTGSGAIALSLAREAGMRVLGTDSNEPALAVAHTNARALDLDTLVRFMHTDLCAGLPAGHFRLVVSNPPYVSTSEHAELAPDVRDYEPRTALVAGEDGLAVIRPLIAQAFAALVPGGALLMEVGAEQAAAVRELLAATGFCRVDVLRDLSGKERIMQAQRPGAVSVSLSEVDEGFRDALRDVLERGALVGLPTDTVYGLAAGWRSVRGVRRLFEAKGRGEERPLAAVFASPESVAHYLPDLDEPTLRVLVGLLPGPYTFIVKTDVERPELVGTCDSLGVRVPDHPSLLGFLTDLGMPLALTSANKSGGEDPPSLAAVDPLVLAHCAIAFRERAEVAFGPAGRPSTVVDLRPLAAGGKPEVLREGAVSREAVLECIEALVC